MTTARFSAYIRGWRVENNVTISVHNVIRFSLRNVKEKTGENPEDDVLYKVKKLN